MTREATTGSIEKSCYFLPLTPLDFIDQKKKPLMGSQGLLGSTYVTAEDSLEGVNHTETDGRLCLTGGRGVTIHDRCG